jgi:two-component system chemotaxis sensor kinase CheA
LQNLPGVAGGAILGDGDIALILDPANLLKSA